MTDYTPYQRDVIGRYYDNRDEIMLARLGEIVSELYLAETDAKRDRLWKRAAQAMQALKIRPTVADRLVSQRKPEILAQYLKIWLAESAKKGPHGGRKTN